MQRLGLLLVLAGVAVAAARAAESVPPFPESLEAAAVSVPRLDSILDNALLVGNGDINALVYSEGAAVELKLTKNDVWDARLDSKLDPPLPKLAWLKRAAAETKSPAGGRNTILETGWGPTVRDSYHSHPYPCPRLCARLVLSKQVQTRSIAPPTCPGRLDMRRAVAHVAGLPGSVPQADVRALADRNVFLLETDGDAKLLPVTSADCPPATSGQQDGAAWLLQEIPGDLDWPGMSFAVAIAGQGHTKAVAIVTSREASNPREAAVQLARAVAEPGPWIARHEAAWQRFWSASGVSLGDRVLEAMWYRNLYFLRCVSKPGAIAPGLFAGLIHGSPAWHGDYHTNYNIQQTFWSAFATNHPDLAEPYDRLVREYFPRARWLAREIFAMEGAYYPHVLFAYEPPEPQKCKSPVGRQYIHHVWGFTLGVAGFTVQPVWWHYKYQPDRKFLEATAYPAVRDVALWQAAFLDQCEGGDRAVLAPSVSPEHWGWTPHFERNRNSAFDIAMFRYTFEAAIEGATTLARDANLVARWKKALGRLPAYPTTQTDAPIVVDVEGAPPITYNIAVPAVAVFPGDVVTWWSAPAEKTLFARTIEGLKWNGNNSAIMLPVARARLSMPGTADYLRETLQARLRPNGTLGLNVLGSRFNDFGHYTEQFASSMAVAELLLQSVGDVIRVFPAWPAERDAAFRDLRTQGGFLVSAEQRAGRIATLSITSTAGGTLRLLSPWKTVAVQRASLAPQPLAPDARGIVQLETRAGERLGFRPR